MKIAVQIDTASVSGPENGASEISEIFMNSGSSGSEGEESYFTTNQQKVRARFSAPRCLLLVSHERSGSPIMQERLLLCMSPISGI